MKKEIARIGKNAEEEIIVQLTNFMNKDLIDIRVWIKSLPHEKKESIPTKKGISMNIECFQDLMEALTKADKVLKELKNSNNGNIK